MLEFKQIAVIGAGTMGSGIAAQIANAGNKVLLMDLPRDDDPIGVLVDAKKRLLKSDPPALVHKSRIDLIEVGNIRDDFDKLANCDWIVEAVVERLDVKKDLYKRLNEVIDPNCVVTSNTSTIPISLLVEDMPEDFQKRFAITHYFNPVRYMRLLELVRGANTDEKIMDRLADYNDRVMGKGVVRCNDTPGFLGNRVGVFALQVGMDEASRNKALDFIKSLVAKPEMGKIYKGKVVKIMEFGAFVNFLGKQDGLVHISELAEKRVAKVGDVVKEGDEVSVKVVGFDRGKVKLSIKQATT